jgi:hypothetical protein
MRMFRQTQTRVRVCEAGVDFGKYGIQIDLTISKRLISCLGVIFLSRAVLVHDYAPSKTHAPALLAKKY